MAQRFSGWSEQAIEVLHELEGVPTHATRARVRRAREELVRRPMIDLLNDVADADPTFEEFSVWGCAETPWWWQHQCGQVRIARHVEILVRFDLDGLHITGAWHYPDPGEIARYRSAVDGVPGPRLEQIIETLRGRGYDMAGDTMKRVPRGFAQDHPRADLLRYRSIKVGTTSDDEADLRSAGASGWSVATMRELTSFLTWFVENVANG